MATTQQLSLPFACLDFPGRSTVRVWEIAAKVGVSHQHVFEHIDAGKLVGVDTALVQSRRNLCVPVDEYRRWVLSLLTGPARVDFIKELPAATRRQIAAEIAASFAA